MATPFVHSAIATVVAEMVTLPICTVKTQYVNSTSTNITHVCQKMYKEHGIRAFYRASVPSVMSQAFSTSTKFGIYDCMRKRGVAPVLSGIISGIGSSLLTHPMDVFKIYWQMNSAVKSQINEHGLKVLYRGYSKSLVKVVTGSVLFFPLTDKFRSLSIVKDPFINTFIASAGAAVVSTLVIHPVDYLKTRHVYGNAWTERWNPMAYYKGVSLNLLRVVPHFTIVMCIIHILGS